VLGGRRGRVRKRSPEAALSLSLSNDLNESDGDGEALAGTVPERSRASRRAGSETGVGGSPAAEAADGTTRRQRTAGP